MLFAGKVLYHSRMAKRVINMLVDDLDGTEAESTVRFAYLGTQYEIDLSVKNAAALSEVLAPWIAAATRVGRGSVVPGGRAAKRSTTTADRDQNRAIREWAQSKGIAVSDRGRIKQEIVDRFNAEHVA